MKLEKDQTIKIILYVIAAILVMGLILLAIFPGVLQAWGDAGKSADEKCRPGPGYTEESWREHMSHHPNIYRECL